MISLEIFAENFNKPEAGIIPKQYVCYQTNTPLLIDGKMDEEDWQKAEWTDWFSDIEGDKQPVPYLKTRAKMLYDKDNLYIYAWLEDKDLWATLKNHDDVIFHDNDFEIFIDPDGDTHDYYEIEINSFNTIWDLYVIKPYRDRDQVALDGWDAKGLNSAVFLQGTINDNRDQDEYWTVEMAIPWESIKQAAHKETPPKNNDLWRMNFSRVHYLLEKDSTGYKKQDKPCFNWVWSNQGLVAMHYPEQWGYIQFSELPVSKGKTKIKSDSLINEKAWLRQIYYAQKQYFFDNAKYANNLKSLKLKNLINKEQYELKIYITPNTYEIILTNRKTNKTLYLYRDGRILDKLDFH